MKELSKDEALTAEWQEYVNMCFCGPYVRQCAVGSNVIPITENERKAQEELENKLPEPEYTRRGSKLRAAFLIADIALCVILFLVGFIYFMCMIFFGLDGDGYSARLAISGVVMMFIGGLGALVIYQIYSLTCR